MELLIKHNLEVKKMSKEELKKIVEGKTAEEQEMILSLLGEEKLLAIRRFNGGVKEYTPDGIITYPTMQEYLQRFKKIPAGMKTPFDYDDSSEQENMPFN